MSGGFQVDTAGMRAHAGRLDHVSQSGADATEAANTVACNGEAFGILCSFVGAALLPVQQAGYLQAKLAQESVKGTAAGVRAMADGYDLVDQAVEKALKKLGGN